MVYTLLHLVVHSLERGFVRVEAVASSGLYRSEKGDECDRCSDDIRCCDAAFRLQRPFSAYDRCHELYDCFRVALRVTDLEHLNCEMYRVCVDARVYTLLHLDVQLVVIS